MTENRRKKVLCPIEMKNGKTRWMKVGAAFVNRDGSWNVHLDVYPTNGKLQIRELDERDLRPPTPTPESGPAQSVIPF